MSTLFLSTDGLIVSLVVLATLGALTGFATFFVKKLNDNY